MDTHQRNDKPRVGVGVVVVKDGKVLLGKRKGAHGDGTWSTIGGHLEFGETPEECAKRELLEEAGLHALSLQLAPWTNDIMEGGKHYVTLFVIVNAFEGEPQCLEPDKCEEWIWMDWDHLPTPLFSSVRSLIDKMGLENLKCISSHAIQPNYHTLLSHLLNFYDERDWEQFHSPKNVVMDLAAEVGELVEPFRWLTEQESTNLDPKTLQEVQDEIGDVFKIIIYLSHKLNIDPVAATYAKLQKMKEKYPAELCKGKAQKYTAYEHAKDC